MSCINKKVVQSRFHKASKRYDQFALMQRKSAKILTAQLRKFAPTFNPQTILDVGAGTGFMPECLLEYYPHANFSVNDIAPGMLDVATRKLRERGTQFECVLGDMEQVNFAKRDLIISNLAFQWAHKLNELIASLYKKSKLLAFSTLLKGSLAEWDRVLVSHQLPPVERNYPDESSMVSLLDSLSHFNHFYVRKFQFYFPRNKSFIEHLKNTGTSALNTAVPISQFKQCLNSAKPLRVTYKIFFGIVGK